VSGETPAVLVFDCVSKRYGSDDRSVWALHDTSLHLGHGEFVSIVGPSGSGKTTILNLSAGLDTPSSGKILVMGRSLADLSANQLAQMRRETVSFVFQFANLLGSLTAARNVAVPLRADGVGREETERRVAAALRSVGMAERADHYPDELSGGELQRVAIARALATDAKLLLVDEPTGNLDSVRGEEIMELLRRAVDERGRSVLLVTHDNRAAAYGDRIITLRDGRIVDVVERRTSRPDVVPLKKR
jgi:putative ABC transport system ATP-binding protein